MEYAKKNKDMLQNLSDDAKVRQCELCASMEQKMVAAEKMKEADARKPEDCKPEPEDDKKAKKADTDSDDKKVEELEITYTEVVPFNASDAKKGDLNKGTTWVPSRES